MYDLNQKGEYTEAHDLIKQLHEQNGWGRGKPWASGGKPSGYGGNWVEKMEYWMDKKEMMETTGLTDIMKGFMTQEFMEDMVEVIENAGGVEGIFSYKIL